MYIHFEKVINIDGQNTQNSIDQEIEVVVIFLSSQIKPFFETGYIFRGRVLVFFCLLPFYSWLFDKEPKLCWLVTIVCEQTNKNRFFQSRNTYKNSWVRYHPFFGKSLTRDYYDNPDLKNLSRMETVKDFSFVHS